MVSTPARISMSSSDTRIREEVRALESPLLFFSFPTYQAALQRDSSTIFPLFFSWRSSYWFKNIGAHEITWYLLFFYTFAIIDYCSNFVSFQLPRDIVQRLTSYPDPPYGHLDGVPGPSPISCNIQNIT